MIRIVDIKFVPLTQLDEEKAESVPHLCLHVFTLGGTKRNMCKRPQCEKDSVADSVVVGECDVSLCQGYAAIWAAPAMIRLKYKVL